MDQVHQGVAQEQLVGLEAERPGPADTAHQQVSRVLRPRQRRRKLVSPLSTEADLRRSLCRKPPDGLGRRRRVEGSFPVPEKRVLPPLDKRRRVW